MSGSGMPTFSGLVVKLKAYSRQMNVGGNEKRDLEVRSYVLERRSFLKLGVYLIMNVYEPVDESVKKTSSPINSKLF